MSANLERIKAEGEKRIKQLEYIKQKFGKLVRTDLIGYSPVMHVEETNKDIARIRSNISVADTVYDRAGMLDSAKTKQFCDYFRAIVVYEEIVFELRQLFDGMFGSNIHYMFQNPEGKQDKEAELAYLTEHPEKVDAYVAGQRVRIRSSQPGQYVTIDETLPYGL